MRRVVLLATIALVLGSASQALAEDSSDDSGYKPSVSNSEDGETNQPDSERDLRHEEIRKHHSDITRVIIPPVAIKPGFKPNPDVYQLPLSPTAEQILDSHAPGFIDSLTDNLMGIKESNEFSSTQVGKTQSSKLTQNPYKLNPVQLKDLVLTKTTPMDDFLKGALTLGLTLMGLAGLFLGITTVNSLRLRKKAKSE